MKTKANRKLTKLSSNTLSVLLLAATIFITCFPFLLMILGSFKEDYEIYTLTPRLFPRNGFKPDMYRLLIENWSFFRNLFNSVGVATLTTAGACFFCTLAGFAFAKYKFPGKNILFLLVLSSLMLPIETRLIPTYLIFKAMHGIDKIWSLILPGLVPAFGVFMIRQFAGNGVPEETMESARIEGASESRILFIIGFPMLKPGIFSLAILTFMNTWNDFLWPIIIMSSKEKLTVMALLRSIGDVSLNGNTGVLLAATTLSAIPILLIYLLFNKQLIEGIMEGTGKE